MASTQEFRRRIKSVNNTKQITKAMEMVSSVKMQKAVKTISNARSYVQNSWNIFEKLAKLTLPSNHPLLEPKKIGKTVIIFVSSDRGLCGSYNSDLFKKIMAHQKESIDKDFDVIAIGKKGATFIRNYKVGNLVAAFPGFDTNIDLEDIIPISKLTLEEYLLGKYDKVLIVYSHFVSSLNQSPVINQILPIKKDHIDLPELWETAETEKEQELEYKIEPNPDKIIDKLLRRFVRLQIFGAILEANASAHSASMVAMKNATDNAGTLIEELTLTYNSIRQNSITNEIAEISGAVEAMK